MAKNTNVETVVTVDSVVKVKMKVTTAGKDFEEETDDDGSFILIGHNDTLPAIEKALMGKKVGDKIHLKLEPEDAFGESDPTLIMAVPNSILGDHIEEGMKVAGTVLDPTDENIYTVLGPASSGETILDGNHPLAGEALTIDIEILEINKPTKEEIENMESQAASSDLFEISEVTRDQLPH